MGVTDDIDAIVRGLSKAQREFLAEMPCYAVSSYPPAKWLVSKGVAEWSDTSWCVPTPRGIAVRNRIMAQKGGDV